jgi:hypothetical protein
MAPAIVIRATTPVTEGAAMLVPDIRVTPVRVEELAAHTLCRVR